MLNTKRIRRRRKSEIAISMPILCDPEPLALASDHVTRVVLGVEIMFGTGSIKTAEGEGGIGLYLYLSYLLLRGRMPIALMAIGRQNRSNGADPTSAG